MYPKNDVLKAKKTGTLSITATDQSGTVSTCNLTILNKPKLKVDKKYSKSDIGSTIDMYDFFKTEDTLTTAADYWESSNEKVAKVDPETGDVELVGTGKAKITAYFGSKDDKKNSLKVRGKITVKKK